MTPEDRAVEAAAGWVDWRARRELAYQRAFELLVRAEIARANLDVRSAVDLTDRAAAKFDALGMHGPVILDEILHMTHDARIEARRRSHLDVDALLASLGVGT